MEGGQVANHPHTHKCHYSNHSNQRREHRIRGLCTEHPDTVIARRVSREEVVTACIAEAISCREKGDEETKSENQE